MAIDRPTRNGDAPENTDDPWSSEPLPPLPSDRPGAPGSPSRAESRRAARAAEVQPGSLDETEKTFSPPEDGIVDARGSGLEQAAAQSGLDRFLKINPERMRAIRIVGDAYDIEWLRE
ncbi:hypothetical protein [Actinomadura decatromicini]|uniref:Uncharacterized protein n=1 Tax=Actinomadura decatromicini TaxID=2604572 RepID=A0A5D3F793_9ACTN|nr:hypothetical protein [Actinomadura decatromicini]TYK43774.1 hypothetical protein FXF68_37185 [Actinomadura decatromicini]